MSFLHEFYVSITQSELNLKTNRLEIAVKVFTDDMINAVENGTTLKLYIGEDREHTKAKELVHQYFENHFGLTVNDSLPINLNVLGFEPNVDVTWVYIESDSIPTNVKSVEIFNNILTDILPKQSNIVKFKVLDQSESMVLDRTLTKANFLINE